MKKYGILLVGCGHMGAAHLNDIYCKENIKLVGVSDIDEEKARFFARKYGASNWSVDYKTLLDNSVDIVIIATYPSSHLAILRDCLKARKHVICEKPISTSLKEAKEFVELVKHAKSKVLVGHILRHNLTYRKVAEMVQSGAIGKPIIMRMVQNHHTMDWDKYLKLIKETSPIIDCGVHYIDVMRWFTQEDITNISGVGLKTEEDVPEGKYNYGIITAELSDGSVAYYEAGWSNTMSSDNLKEFIGPKGRIKLVFKKDRMSHQEEGDLIEYYRYPEKTYEIINIDCKRKPTGAQLDHLINMIENGVSAVPTIDEVYQCFEIAVEADNIIKKKIDIMNCRSKCVASSF